MCGIVGVVGVEDAGKLAVFGLQAMQHRGQDAAGVMTFDSANGKCFHEERHLGLVGDSFTKENIIETLKGNSAIGHTLYRTSGSKKILKTSIQPFFASSINLAVAHNGNLPEGDQIRDTFIDDGAIFNTDVDTEVILHLVVQSKKEDMTLRITEALQALTVAYSLVFLAEGKLIGARDPLGIRPLFLGRKNGGYVLASETCAFRLMGAEFVRAIDPGEIITIDEAGTINCLSISTTRQSERFCIFEWVYFSKPNSQINGEYVYDARKRLGRELAIEAPVEADFVVPVPDSGLVSGLGYANQSGIPLELGLSRDHYIGRTFIEPNQGLRDMKAHLKYGDVGSVFDGKRIILVDDSIVRGTTIRKLIQMLKSMNALEVHVRISSPPITEPCNYGIDTPSREELIAHRCGSVEEMRKEIGADSLVFLSRFGLYNAVRGTKNSVATFCDACFTGDHPTLLQ